MRVHGPPLAPPPAPPSHAPSAVCKRGSSTVTVAATVAPEAATAATTATTGRPPTTTDPAAPRTALYGTINPDFSRGNRLGGHLTPPAPPPAPPPSAPDRVPHTFGGHLHLLDTYTTSSFFSFLKIPVESQGKGRLAQVANFAPRLVTAISTCFPACSTVVRLPGK